VSHESGREKREKAKGTGSTVIGSEIKWSNSAWQNTAGIQRERDSGQLLKVNSEFSSSPPLEPDVSASTCSP